MWNVWNVWDELSSLMPVHCIRRRTGIAELVSSEGFNRTTKGSKAGATG